jgi:hypothetical protein
MAAPHAMTIEPWYVFMGGLAAYSVFAVVRYHTVRRRRREAFAEFCLLRGFKFDPQKPEGERRFRDVFEDFQKGNEKSWQNEITGTKNGVPFTAFEYVWTEGKATSFRSGIIWERDDVSLPKFELWPEGWLSRIAQVFGMQDIDFNESPEFSQAYHLRGLNESAIRACFTPEIRQFLAVTPNQHVTGGGRFLIWWSTTLLPPPSGFDEWLEHGDQVRRRFFKA